MKRVLATTGLLVLAVLAYLLAWPTSVAPVAWQAPVDRGYVDPFAPNALLQTASGIDLGEFEGPEDATLGHDGKVYATTAGGEVIRIENREATQFAFVGGRPLGIETDADGSLVVANAYHGLQRIQPDGTVVTLHGGNGSDVFANNLAIGADGTVYFSEATRKFSAKRFRDTMDATLFDVLEHGAHGRVVAFDPQTGEAETLIDGLAYANGVAISAAGDYLLVVEMNEYRVLKYWLAGPRRGQTQVLLENLPGFADNLKRGRGGRFWLGFAAPRNPLVDKLADKPWLRKVIARLPAAVRPAAEPYSHVIAFDGNGEILMNMHDPLARYPMLTGVLETERSLYLTTLYGNVLPVIAKQDL